jgi:hypothetical protein
MQEKNGGGIKPLPGHVIPVFALPCAGHAKKVQFLTKTV